MNIGNSDILWRYNYETILHIRLVESHKHEWFTDGSISQYDKLFDLNNNGATLEELALVIYICSSNATRDEILHTLEVAKNELYN